MERVLPGVRPQTVRTLWLLLCTGARIDSVARPALALRVLGSRLCLACVGPNVLYGRLRFRMLRLLQLCWTGCAKCDTRIQLASAACKRIFRRALSSGEARAKALRPAASAAVGGADLSQRYGSSHSSVLCEEGAPRPLVVASAALRWRRRVGGTIQLRV